MHLLSRPSRSVIVAAMVLGVLLGGCTGQGEDSALTGASAGTYVEPGWMAEARQGQEQDTTDMVACLAEAGWEAEITPDYGYKPAGTLTTEQFREWGLASSECVSSLWGDLPERTEAEWRLKYAHALDTRDCLVAHGYTISDPPSEDSWVETALSGQSFPWTPFGYLFDEVLEGHIPMDEPTYYALYAACAQDGPIESMGGWEER